MKKLLSFLLLIIAVSFQALADGNAGNSSSSSVGIEFHPIGLTTIPHRAPTMIDLEVIYNSDAQMIEITYSGETSGEVYLYRNDSLIDYDTEINTSFSLPEATGAYHIVIITENWTANGYLEL